MVIAVLCLVDVVIQRSVCARPLVVHVDKVKLFLDDPLPSWVADETATKVLLGDDSPARAEPTTDSFQFADEPETDRMTVDTGSGDDSPEPVGLLAASPARLSISPSAPILTMGVADIVHLSRPRTHCRRPRSICGAPRASAGFRLDSGLRKRSWPCEGCVGLPSPHLLRLVHVEQSDEAL